MNYLDDLEMNVHIELTGKITSIIGPTNSGKTVFLKRLCNQIPNNDITIDEVPLSEYDITFKKNNIVVCLDDNHFVADYVAEELYYYLNKLGYRIDEATLKIQEIAKFFKISDILNERISNLRINQKMLVKILSFLIIEPKIFGIDNLLVYLNRKEQSMVIKYIKEHGINLICVTSDPNFLLLSEDVVIMNNFKAVLASSSKSLIDGNSILPYMGIKLPFIVDLSHNLILYQVIDKVYLEDKKLVDKLWK